MALSTVVFTQYAYPNGSSNDQRRQLLQGTLAISASPGTYPTGGFSLAGVFKVEAVKSSNWVPVDLTVKSVSGSGYTYLWNKTNNTLQIFLSGGSAAVMGELAAGSTPAGVSGDTIDCKAEFARNV